MKETTHSTSIFTPAIVFLWIVVIARTWHISIFVWPLLAGLLMTLLYTFVVWTSGKKQEENSKKYVSLFAMGVYMGLSIHPQEGFAALLFAILLAACSFQFRIGGMPLVIPPVFGLVVASMFVGFPLSWWGLVAGGKLFSVMLYIVFLARSYYRKGVLVVIIGYFLFFLFTKPSIAVSVILDPVVALFSVVLVPEILSAARHAAVRRMLPLGILAIVLAMYQWGLSLGDPLLFAALFAQAAAVISSSHMKR